MRAKRIVQVTAGLALAGFTFGGIAGAVLIFLLGFPADGWTVVPEILLLGAAFGAVFGIVLGPIGAWLLMRDVPLGLAVGGTTLGTIIGGAAAFVSEAPDSILYGPVAGFAVAAVALRIHARLRRRALPAGTRASALHG